MQQTQKNEYSMKLGSRIKELRVERGLSVVQLADLVGLTRQSIYNLEAGLWVLPRRDTLFALAEALGTTTTDLLTAAGYVESVFDPEAIRIGRIFQRLPKEVRAGFLKAAQAYPVA